MSRLVERPVATKLWAAAGEKSRRPKKGGRTVNFYDHYVETVTKNDERTRSSVDSIMGRMDKLLADPDEECHATGRLSGLVVGRVQSGKTRNYIGLALKAADAGWNVIIVLTSAITALATIEKSSKYFGLDEIYGRNLKDDKARFNKLITPKVMAKNHIAQTCGKPVTWQYQG